jgi:hypothetical protein
VARGDRKGRKGLTPLSTHWRLDGQKMCRRRVDPVAPLAGAPHYIPHHTGQNSQKSEAYPKKGGPLMEQKNAVTLLSGKQWLLILLVSILLLSTVALMYSKLMSTKTTHAATTLSVPVTIHSSVPGTSYYRVSDLTVARCLDVVGSNNSASFTLVSGIWRDIVPYAGGTCGDDDGTRLNYVSSIYLPPDATNWTGCDVTFTPGISIITPVCK